MIIEELKINDIQLVQDFMLGIIKDDFGYDFNPEWHKDIVDIENMYINNPKSCFFVAKDNDLIVGTIGARPYDKEYPEFVGKYSKETTLSIWRHYIKKDQRGLGIGTKLLKKVEDFAVKEKYKYIYLHTQKTIKGSLEYWLAKGFSITVTKEDLLSTVHLQKSI